MALEKSRHLHQSTRGQTSVLQQLSAAKGAQHVTRHRRRWYLSPEGFRELRLGCLLSRGACAALLGCSVLV